MGLITSDSIQGLNLLGFGKSKKISQTDKKFPYDEGYLTSSDVYAVTSKIAKNGKSIEWILKKETNGKIEEVTEGELFNLIQNPNPSQTRAEFVEMALLFLLLSGEVFQRTLVSEIITSAMEVDLLNPQLTTIDVGKLGTKYFPKSYRFEGQNKNIDVDTVEHLKYANPSVTGTRSLRGLSPLVAGGLTVIGLNNNQEANATILEHQGAAGILSNESDMPMTDPERELAQSTLDKLLAGVRNFGKIIQSTVKLKFTRLGLDPTQLKLIESKLLKFRDLCTIYDVKSILFNDPVNASFNNLTNAEKQFWTNAAIPNTQLIVNMFNDGVVARFNEKSKKDRFFIELDVASIPALQADQKKEAEKDRIKMEGVDKILNMPISSPAKVELLMSEYGYTEETAELIVSPEGKKNVQLEILQSLSPLLANKLVEKLSEQEVRALLGL